jgi:hypothetical protein
MLLRRALSTAGLALALAVSQAPAAEPEPASTTSPTATLQAVPVSHGKATAVASPSCATPMPLADGAAAPPGGSALPADIFAAAPSERGGEAGGSAFPNMFGDLLASQVCGPLKDLTSGQVLKPGTFPTFQAGHRYNFDVFLPPPLNGGVPIPAGQQLPVTFVSPTPVPPTRDCGVAAALLAIRGAFKITENESPRPQDRVYATYNYFNNIAPDSDGGLGQTDVHREVLGVEKTFLGGNASVGLRLPFVQIEGDGTIRREDIGDLSVIGKYALINDCDTGNCLSAGLVVTFATGNSFLPEGIPDIHGTLFQPYVGYIYGLGDRFYVQGFSSILIPTKSDDVTYWFNDIGVGYMLYRAGAHCDDCITSVTPIFEVHVNTPLDHRGSEATPIGGVDIVDLTFGTTVGIRHRAFLNLGVVTPVTGPKPFDVEAQVQLNYRF